MIVTDNLVRKDALSELIDDLWRESVTTFIFISLSSLRTILITHALFAQLTTY